MRLDLPARARLVDVEEFGLPSDWRTDEAATQTLGNEWIARCAALGLWVPSFVEPAERNLLLNPAHPSYGFIKLHIERQPFAFDRRLF